MGREKGNKRERKSGLSLPPSLPPSLRPFLPSPLPLEKAWYSGYDELTSGKLSGCRRNDRLPEKPANLDL